MVVSNKIGLVLLLLFFSCSTKKLTKTNQILILSFVEFTENPKQFKGQTIGVQGYYVMGMARLYRDKEFYEFVSKGSGFDSTKFDYLHMITLPNHHKTQRPETLAYLEGAYVVVYGKAKHLDKVNNTFRYGGHLLADSIVIQKSP